MIQISDHILIFSVNKKERELLCILIISCFVLNCQPVNVESMNLPIKKKNCSDVLVFWNLEGIPTKIFSSNCNLHNIVISHCNQSLLVIFQKISRVSSLRNTYGGYLCNYAINLAKDALLFTHYKEQMYLILNFSIVFLVISKIYVFWQLFIIRECLVVPDRKTRY